MARDNRIGLAGTTYWRREDGSMTDIEQSVYIHFNRLIVDIKEELVKIRFGIWESKAAMKSGVAELDILGGVQPEYTIDNSIKSKKGRDKHSGDTTTVEFGFTKPNAGAEYLQVKVDGEIMVLGKDYTVSYTSGSSGTGTVTFTTAPGAGVDNIHLIRLVGAFTEYFANNKTTAANHDHFTKAIDFLTNIDGSDIWDPIKIDFSSFVEDATA